MEVGVGATIRRSWFTCDLVSRYVFRKTFRSIAFARRSGCFFEGDPGRVFGNFNETFFCLAMVPRVLFLVRDGSGTSGLGGFLGMSPGMGFAMQERVQERSLKRAPP